MKRLYANVSFDYTLWLQVPLSWGEYPSWASPQQWAEETARDKWRLNNPRGDDVACTAGRLAILAEAYGVRREDDPETIAYIHLPHPAALPLVVKVWIDDPSGRSIQDLVRQHDPNSIEPPVIEEFSSPNLGSGLTSLRYQQADLSRGRGPGKAEVFGVLDYVFEIPEENAILIAKSVSPDLGRLVQARDDIEEFVQGIQWGYEPQDLAYGPKD